MPNDQQCPSQGRDCLATLVLYSVRCIHLLPIHHYWVGGKASTKAVKNTHFTGSAQTLAPPLNNVETVGKSFHLHASGFFTYEVAVGFKQIHFCSMVRISTNVLAIN